MDVGGSSESHEERGAEKMMDDYLKSIDLHRKKIAKDGSCLFRAVAEQVLHCQSLHTKVRAQCVEFLRKNRQTYEAFIEGDFEDYLHKLQDPQQWVGEVEINALAVMYKRDFLIFQEPGKQAVNITSNNFTDTVMLCFLNGNHYDSVYPISHLKNSALCQSILYELLYDGVFKVDQSVLAQSQRAGRNDVLSDDNLPVCGSSDESDTDPGEALWVESEGPAAPKHNKGRGRRGTHLPERVRRSLNPSMFRNIEYDIWHKTKRAQQKMDYHIAAGMQFSVGDRCKVCLDGSGRGYIATIKQLSPDNGLVTVYSEDFGQNEVPLWNLRPPTNEAKSWSVVASREKRIGNGHGDWEGRGRGRGKHTLASSSAVTGLGSNGRVMKQQSWPPLAPGEEQAGGKTRRSVSTVDSSFGLTEEQRLAKEEEERNIALVEIQRRDEHSFPALGTPTMGDGGRKKAMDKKRAQRTKTRSPVEDIHVEAPSEGRQPRPASPTPPTAPPTARVPSPMVSAASALVIEKPPAAPPTKSDSSKAQLNGGPAASSPAVAASSTSTTKPFSASHAARPTSPLAAAAATTTKPSMVAVGGAVPLSSPSTAPSPSFLTPILPVASSPPTSGALSSSSPTPSSSSISGTSTKSIVPLPPTFIAPVAPFSTQGFLPHNSGPGSSVAPHSVPSSAPHPLPSSTPHHLPSSAFQPLPSPALNFSHSVAAQIHSASSVSTQTPTVEATVAASQTPQIQSKADYVPSLPPSQTQASVTREDPQPSTALNQSTVPQMLLETKTFPQQSHPLHMQHQSVPHAEVASVPDTQSPSPSVCHCSSQAPVSHLEPHSNPPPDASYHHHHQPHPHHTAQSTVPSTAAQQLPPSVVYSHPSTTSIQLPLHSQIPVRLTDQPEMALPSANPQPHLHAHPQHSAQHTHQPPVMPALPPPLYSQSIPGVVPLQQLSQLYQDPLYPGFPQGEKGSVAPIPPFSSCKFGEDLPQDKNILRFFYNLGVKAYSMPMYPPCIYLLPLQQTHTMHPQRPSRSPSPSPTPAAQYSTTSVPAPAPLYSSANHPVHHQEAYPQQQYPPPSLPSHFEQAPIAPQHTEVFHSTRYPVTEPSQQQQQQQKQQQQQQQQQQLPCLSLPWQQQQISPANSSSFPVSYPSSTPHYPLPQQISQGYHPSQGPGVPLYTTGVPVYPHTTLGYQPSPARVHEEPQVNLEVLEKSQHTCGPAETVQSAMAASLVNTNSGSVVLPGFAVKKDPIESANRAVLLVDPTLNSKPMLVSNSVMKDVPVAMTTVKSSSTPGSPLHQELLSKTAIAVDNSAPRGYQGHQQLLHPTSTYTSLGGPEPSLLGYPPTVAGPTSVGCNTNEDWEEETQGKQTRINHRGVRRNYRGGGRWRGNYDPQRGAIRKRCEGDTGPAHGYTHYSSSHRGRGRGY